MSSDHGSGATRTEKDSLGTKEIPAQVYYGIQTARAVENYPISGVRAHPTLIRAIAMVKEAFGRRYATDWQWPSRDNQGVY